MLIGRKYVSIVDGTRHYSASLISGVGVGVGIFLRFYLEGLRCGRLW